MNLNNFALFLLAISMRVFFNETSIIIYLPLKLYLSFLVKVGGYLNVNSTNKLRK